MRISLPDLANKKSPLIDAANKAMRVNKEKADAIAKAREAQVAEQQDWKLVKEKKRTKFGAIKTEVDGIVFDSKAEAKRYMYLKHMQAAGKISGLRIHPKYPIEINGKYICEVELDFFYFDKEKRCIEYEDVKGVDTAISRLKRKLIKVTHDIDVTIIKARSAGGKKGKAREKGDPSKKRVKSAAIVITDAIAHSIAHFIDIGWKNKAIAEKLGINQSTLEGFVIKANLRGKKTAIFALRNYFDEREKQKEGLA